MRHERREPRILGIRVLPVGSLPADVLDAVAARLSGRLSLPCRTAAPKRPVPVPLLAGRPQADADGLLAALEALSTTPGEIVLGLSTVDIGHPIFTHFFGRARHHGRAALVSLARLTPEFYGLPPDPGLCLERACREAIHELGHVAGLLHCPDFACVMRFAPTVDVIDVRGAWFCRSCLAGARAALPALAET